MADHDLIPGQRGKKYEFFVYFETCLTKKNGDVKTEKNHVIVEAETALQASDMVTDTIRKTVISKGFQFHWLTIINMQRM